MFCDNVMYICLLFGAFQVAIFYIINTDFNIFQLLKVLQFQEIAFMEVASIKCCCINICNTVFLQTKIYL